MREPFAKKYGPTALIAGASEGLGAAFAEAAAKRGLDLCLVARRADALEDLAKKIRAEHAVAVKVVPLDLASPTLAGDARQAIEGLEVGLLVYNAAASLIGPFLEQSIEDKLRIIDVNCRGPLVLADVVGRGMLARRRGGIVLMSSMVATQGGPFIATYSASKAFNLVLAEGLWDELRGSGVDVLACRAGATRTPAYERSKPASNQGPMMEPGPVAEQALDALGSGPSMVPGIANRLAALAMQRVLPRRAAVATMGKAMRKMYR